MRRVGDGMGPRIPSPPAYKPRGTLWELKTWPGAFQELLDGLKVHEVRREDRGQFQQGDVLWLREFLRPITRREVMAAPSLADHGATMRPGGQFTGRCLFARVLTVTRDGDRGMPPGLLCSGVALMRVEVLCPVQMLGAISTVPQTQPEADQPLP